MNKTSEIEPVYRAIGARVQMLRETLGRTQEDVARACGMSRPSLANIEAGRQRLMLHDIERISMALATTPRHMLKGIWT